MNIPGKFIVIEGLEGAGKSSAINVIKTWLQAHGIENVVTTREPGGTPIAETLRNILKSDHDNEIVYPTTELLLLYAARVQLVKNIIQPALIRGDWVIGDRHELSTRAYQGGGRGIPLSNLQTLYDLCLGDFKPDLTFYLDISPTIGLARVTSRGTPKDRIEKEAIAFFDRVRAVYRSYINPEHAIFEVDALQPMQHVQEAIIKILENYVTA